MTARSNTVRKLAPGALVLTGLALGLLVAPMLRDVPAFAQPAKNVDAPPFNSTEDRKAIVSQLTDVNQRLGRIEAKLNSGLSVKVTEMPAITLKDPAK